MDTGNETCYYGLKFGFYDLKNMENDPSHWAKMKEIWNLCDMPTHPDNITSLIGLVNDAIGTMAMVNYPYPTNFVNPLPAWPIKNMCKQVTTIPPSETPAAADFSVFNYTFI